MKMIVFADPMLKRQGKEMMKSSVDEGINNCDVVLVTLQFRSEDLIARSVAVCLRVVVLCFASVAVSRSSVSFLH